MCGAELTAMRSVCLAFACSQHAAVVTADKRFLFIYGGYDGTKCLKDVWLVDLQTKQLRQLEIENPAPEARSRHTVHIIENLLHVFGGYDGGKPTAGDVFTLDVSDPANMESEGEGEKKKEEGGKGGDDED